MAELEQMGARLIGREDLADFEALHEAQTAIY
jgi:hypothetical protein